MKLFVKIEHDPSFRGTDLYIYGVEKDQYFLVEPMELHMIEINEYEKVERPTLKFRGNTGEEFLRSLADALVEIGYRPNELKAKEGVIEALKFHLEDMRKLAFKDK
jgi:hypothetical protein